MADKSKTDVWDFSGWATKANIKCSDGRTIAPNAFAHMNGKRVPLVWKHLQQEPSNVLGYGILEALPEGVMVHGKFNGTESGKTAKALVEHGDIDSLSIFANQLVEKAKLVHSGQIIEVSLVVAGANPGAKITNVSFQHGDDTIESEDEAIISLGVSMAHEDVSESKDEEVIEHAAGEETVGDVVDSMSEIQKNVMYALIAQAVGGDSAAQSDEDPNSISQGETFMKKNVFEKEESVTESKTLTHDQIRTIFADAQKTGSLKESFMAHVVTYGIENIDYLFPDAKTLTNEPTFVQRDMAWVNVWMSRTRHSPFSRIKTMFADITLDTARALGYIKGSLKKEEFFALAKRVTTPTTIYKKQKLDRDDIVDITDLDVVAWMKREMRMMLDEEVARACLVGDGRDVASEDKINETNIRPVYKDDALYTIRVPLADDATTLEIMDEIVRARKGYKGTGNPVMFTTTDFLTDMLLLKDTLDRRLYPTMNELMAALRVSDIVEVEVLENVTRTDTVPEVDVVYDLKAILLNPSDYVIGADKGGAVAMFDDFDIDYNQYKYLLETRLSGCLVKPKTAIVIEQAQAGN
jgi:phage head maturation protease